MDSVGSATSFPAKRASPSSHFRFLELPAELRNEVYGYLLPSPIRVPRPRLEKDSRISSSTAMMCASRQLHDEMKAVVTRNGVTIELRGQGGLRRDENLDEYHIPAMPIREARSIRIEVFLYFPADSNLRRMVDKLSCCLAEMATIANLLHRREYKPHISIIMRYQKDPQVPQLLHWRTDFFATMPILLWPFYVLSGVPNGVIVTAGQPSILHPLILSEFNLLADEIRGFTRMAGPGLPVAPEMTRLVDSYRLWLDEKARNVDFHMNRHPLLYMLYYPAEQGRFLSARYTYVENAWSYHCFAYRQWLDQNPRVTAF